MPSLTRIARLSAAGLFAAAPALGLAACSDEDGDGGTTDEEIQDIQEGADEVGDDIEDGADSVQDRVDQEMDAQDTGDDQG